MKRNQKLFTVVVILFGLLLAACAAEVSAPDPSDNAITNAGGEDSPEGNSSVDGSSPLGQLGVSLGRTELQASNSSTVSLEGSNKPQLVEFFAYW